MKKTAQHAFPFDFINKEPAKATIIFETSENNLPPNDVEASEDEDLADDEGIFAYEDSPEEDDKKDNLKPDNEESIAVADFSFTLPAVPGADDAEEIVVEEDSDEAEVAEDDGPIDSWDWFAYVKKNGMGSFVDWFKGMWENIPKHDGKGVAGCKRAHGYLKRLEGEVLKAITQDYGKEIDHKLVDDAIDQLEQGLERLEDRIEKLNTTKYKRHSKKNKKAFSEDSGIVKTAETSITGHIVVTVPYLISNWARMCIEATIQGGKDMKEAYEAVCKKFDLDDREKFQLITLIKDMGYPMILDRFNYDTDTNNESEMSEFAKRYYS